MCALIYSTRALIFGQALFVWSYLDSCHVLSILTL